MIDIGIEGWGRKIEYDLNTKLTLHTILFIRYPLCSCGIELQERDWLGIFGDMRIV